MWGVDYLSELRVGLDASYNQLILREEHMEKEWGVGGGKKGEGGRERGEERFSGRNDITHCLCLL